MVAEEVIASERLKERDLADGKMSSDVAEEVIASERLKVVPAQSSVLALAMLQKR